MSLTQNAHMHYRSKPNSHTILISFFNKDNARDNASYRTLFTWCSNACAVQQMSMQSDVKIS